MPPNRLRIFIIFVVVIAAVVAAAALFVNSRQTESRVQNENAQSFLAANAGEDDVIQTDSGLQYRVITQTEGPKPAATDRVTVHYRGTLADGTQFDSSYDRGTPATFPLNGVIPGWTEGLQLMSVGSKYVFYIPPELGYGVGGIPDVIPPNAVLIFEVELLAIE